MKICITAEGDNLDAPVDARFGRCNYFIIVDAETLEFEAVKNVYQDAGGGVGIQTAKLMSDKGVELVLSGNIGPNAFETLKAAGIKVVNGISGTVKDVIEQYKKGEIKTKENPNVDSHFGMN